MPEPGEVSVSVRPRPNRAGEKGNPRPGAILAAGVGSALLFSLALAAPLVGDTMSFVMPFLFLGAFVSPFPLIRERLRGGAGSGLLATVLSTALLAAVFSPGQALAFVLVFAGPGLLIGETLARGRGLLRGCAWAFALLSAEISVALLFASGTMADRILEPFAQSRTPEFVEGMKSSGLPADKAAELADQFAAWHDALAIVYPAAYIIMGALVVLANAALLRAYLVRRDPGWLEGGEFEGIRWPVGLSVLFVLAGASIALPAARPAGYNVLLILAFFFALQGLAVVAFYVRRLAAPPFLRAAVVVLVLVNPWAPQILALLGLFDNFLDFRKWAEPPEARPQ
jgi:uncharacterized protein YybS (DUF2232 family)